MKVKKILVVFDPTTDTQIALERAALIAGHEGSEIFLFSCIHSRIPKSEEKKAQIEKLVAAQSDILAAAIKPLVDAGIRVKT